MGGYFEKLLCVNFDLHQKNISRGWAMAQLPFKVITSTTLHLSTERRTITFIMFGNVDLQQQHDTHITLSSF